MADATGRPVELIVVYKDVNEVVLHSFVVDYEKLEATFRARFDGEECPHPFRVVFDSTGLAHVAIEMYPYAHTELCYLVEMPKPVFDAMNRAIRGVFTNILPYPTRPPPRPNMTVEEERLPDAEYLFRIRRLMRDPGFTLTAKP
ncbi:MAG: hypothetical protein ACAH80_07565 [Alphaproteobacteria bacterium]